MRSTRMRGARRDDYSYDTEDDVEDNKMNNNTSDYDYETNVLNQSNVSMDSSLPSAIQPRYQAYPLPPSGVRSLIGGFVALDGESVQLPESRIEADLEENDEETEIVFEKDQTSSVVSRGRPPSVVNLSFDLSGIGSSLYDNIMTFKILGKSNNNSKSSNTCLDQDHDLDNNPTARDRPSRTLRTNHGMKIKTKQTPKSSVRALAAPPTAAAVSVSTSQQQLQQQQRPSLQIKPALCTPSTADASMMASCMWSTPVNKIHLAKKAKDSLRLPSNHVDDGRNPQDCCVCSCCPFWIQRAPLWLKVFLLLSLLFFFVSSSLIAVAVTFALRDQRTVPNDSSVGAPSNSDFDNSNNNDRGISTGNQNQQDRRSFEPVPSPVATKAPSPGQDEHFIATFMPSSPSSDPVMDADPLSPTSLPTHFPSFQPTTQPTTASPTTVPTSAPSYPLTFAPTLPVDSTVAMFFVTAGSWPHPDADAAPIDPAMVLPRMPVRNQQAFLVHLGGWNTPTPSLDSETAVNNATATATTPDCRPERYQQVAQLWSQSSCPVYFLVGHNDSNACADPAAALRNWRDELVDNHRNFWPRPPWTFWDDGWSGYSDMFVFDTNGVIICGLHLTSGSITAGTNRARPAQEAVLDWIDINYDFYRNSRTRRMFLLANAAVDDEVHATFFTTLFTRVQDQYERMNFVWVQPGTVAGLQPAYQGMANFDVLTVAKNTWPPMQIQVNSSADLIFNQDDWFDQQTGLRIST